MDNLVTFTRVEYFYDLVSDRHKYIVKWVIDDTVYTVAHVLDTQMLYYGDNPYEFIMNAFAKDLNSSNVSEETAIHILNALTNALMHAGPIGKKSDWIYQDNTLKSGGSVTKPNEVDVSPHTVISNQARKLPGINVAVDCPCGCDIGQKSLYSTIMHLNDGMNWSRERIADWIDKLHDEGVINAEFSEWDETGMAEEEKEFEQPKNSKPFVSIEGAKSEIVDGVVTKLDLSNAYVIMGDAAVAAASAISNLAMKLNDDDSISFTAQISEEIANEIYKGTMDGYSIGPATLEGVTNDDKD